jgi:hypothetical protein
MHGTTPITDCMLHQHSLSISIKECKSISLNIADCNLNEIHGKHTNKTNLTVKKWLWIRLLNLNGSSTYSIIAIILAPMTISKLFSIRKQLPVGKALVG